MLCEEDSDYRCRSNFKRAILRYGCTNFDSLDVLNVQQVTAHDEDGKYSMRSCPAKVGDDFEFFAETALLKEAVEMGVGDEQGCGFNLGVLLAVGGGFGEMGASQAFWVKRIA